MAAFIEFSDSQMWSTSNWVYWGLMDHLIDALASDTATAIQVETCKWAQSMSFPLLYEESIGLADQVRDKLEITATHIVNGELQCKVDGQEVDQSSQLQFRDEIKHLVETMRENQRRLT
jgi:hypothetical protein